MKPLASRVFCALLLSPIALLAGNSDRYRPMPMGVSGAPANVSYAGTIGALLTDGTKDYILSTASVLSDHGRLQLGSPIVQPAPTDGGHSPADVVARLTAAVVASPGGASPPGADAAMAEVVLPAGQVDAGLLLHDGHRLVLRSSLTLPVRGLRVEKAGRTSGVTTGVVSATGITLQICYRWPCDRYETLQNLFEVDPPAGAGAGHFAAPGDAGSVVFSQGSRVPIGLLVAFDSRGAGYAASLSDVLGELAKVSGRPLQIVGEDGRASRAVQHAAAGAGALHRDSGLAAPLLSERDAMIEELMRDCPACGVQGVGIGDTIHDGGPMPAIVVYAADPTAVDALPSTSPHGTPVRVIVTGAVQSAAASAASEAEER